MANEPKLYDVTVVTELYEIWRVEAGSPEEAEKTFKQGTYIATGAYAEEVESVDEA